MQNESISRLGLILAICIVFFTACETGGPMWPSYTVVYNATDGTGTMINSVHKIGIAKNLTPNTFTRESYSFVGWAKSPNNSEAEFSDKAEVTNLAKGNGDIVTLYALWMRNFTVTFDANGGFGTVPTPQSVAVGARITLPAGNELSKSGYAFGGWNTRADGTGDNFSAGGWFTPAGDTVLFAMWAHHFTVTFDVNGGAGTPPEARSVMPGSYTLLPDGSGLSKTGYAFGGWNTRADGTGGNFSAGANFTPTGDTTLYAVWTLNLTVTFDANGGLGVSPEPRTAAPGSHILLPDGSGLSKTGYSFGGWNSRADGTGNNFQAGANFTPTGNVTLYARWLDNAGVPGATLAEQMAWLRINAQSGGRYVVRVSGNESVTSAQTALPAGRNDISITIRGIGGLRTVSFGENGNLFIVGTGITLVLGDNIVLQGRPANNRPLVEVNSGGTLVMNTGSVITGNINTSTASANVGGAVRVNNGGVFTKHGGTISGSSTTSDGGGIRLTAGGVFTMYGGTISGNTAQWGGGISVGSGSTFNKRGGIISGNSSTSDGAGVQNWGSFRISDGIIYGNAAAADIRNTAGGGGAALSQRGGTALRGTFNAAGDFTSLGALITSEDTIHVVGGVLQP
jgi:uncharacterized repeat protein (TIGR02543 family)